MSRPAIQTPVRRSIAFKLQVIRSEVELPQRLEASLRSNRLHHDLPDCLEHIPRGPLLSGNEGFRQHPFDVAAASTGRALFHTMGAQRRSEHRLSVECHLAQAQTLLFHACMRHLGRSRTAGDRHGLPLQVLAPHRRANSHSCSVALSFSLSNVPGRAVEELLRLATGDRLQGYFAA